MYIPELFLLLLLVIYFITFPRIFERAGEKGWKGYIPFYNFIIWIKILKRPWWWFILLLVPGVNVLVLIILNVETAIAFNMRSAKDQWLAGALPWYFFLNLAFKDTETAWVGPRDWTHKKKSLGREWGEAILFAVIAASVIRSFFLEAFTIPTPSMEGSMLVGDYLFVSKVSYGARLPETPMSIPFVHNVIPGTMANSYVNWFTLPKFRLPGFGHVERYDAVVFNFPHGDSILVHPDLASHDYYAFLRNEAIEMAGSYEKYAEDSEKYKSLARERFNEDKICRYCRNVAQPERGKNYVSIGGVKDRPTDKQDNYVKRCIGLPGEDLEIRDRQVYIDDEAIANPEKLQYKYRVTFNEGFTKRGMTSLVKTDRIMVNEYYPARDEENCFIVPLNAEEVEELRKKSYVKSIEFEKDYFNGHNMEHYFPNVNNPSFTGWTNDNYGPLHIPAKGEQIELTKDNMDLYGRVIEVYENNSLEQTSEGIRINGELTDSYTFKQDYYWMMGDNRDNSADSRAWGFVPEDHIVGKAVFTWFSKEKNQSDGENEVRWKRMFKLVDKDFDEKSE